MVEIGAADAEAYGGLVRAEGDVVVQEPPQAHDMRALDPQVRQSGQVMIMKSGENRAARAPAPGPPPSPSPRTAVRAPGPPPNDSPAPRLPPSRPPEPAPAGPSAQADTHTDD
ncbi:hypothetical protein ACFWSF_37000 [Streptomyces sp. NPDC058611]|uniref:hypothetical protein n=1 Tax=unclassified Streptomyces TaxID=2593676 RepID=UPI003659D3C4